MEQEVTDEVTEETTTEEVNLISPEDTESFENDPPSKTTTTVVQEQIPVTTPGTGGNQNQGSGSGTNQNQNQNPNPGTGTGGNTGTGNTTYVPGQTTVITETTESKNAIQKAVDEALLKITNDTKSITVKVSSGEYNGDISINAGNAKGDVPSDFVLYILSEDSYQSPETDHEEEPGGEDDLQTVEEKSGEDENIPNPIIDKTTIDADSVGGAKVNGNILIEGLNVVLAGLYWSLENTVSVKDGSVAVYGTTQDDHVQVEIGEDADLYKISTGEGSDEVTVKSTSASGKPDGKTIHIDTGAGDDKINVDVSAANHAENVEIDAGEGEDRIHFTGELKKDGRSSAKLVAVEEPNNIEETLPEVQYEPEVNLENSNGKMLAFEILNAEIYTDALSNKKQIEVIKDALNGSEGAIKKYAANEIFVDYICEDSGDLTVSNVEIEGTGFLTSLILKCADTLRINNLFASGINLILKAQEIILDGITEAKSILAEAIDDDAFFDINIPSVEEIGIQAETVTIGSDISRTTATITVREGATVRAEDAIDFSASSTQKASLLPEGTGYNFMSIKVGDAIIDILGNIISGGSFDAKTSVLIKSSASNTSLAQWFIPLGIAVAVSESKIHVGREASITAASHLSLLANSSVTISNIATMGTLPISLALSVVTADTLVDVEGDLLSKTGSVKLGAKGIVNLTTTAAEKSFASTNMTANPNGSISIIPGANGSNGSLSSGNTGTTGGSKSGGFFAVAVALQDVAVKVRENADITAAKDVVILSESEERVNTRATSGDGSTASETKSVGSVVDIITLLINSAQTKLTNHFQMGNKLDGAKQQVEGTDGYEVRSTATDKGTVVVPAKVKAGETVTVRVTPKEGFRLTGLTYTYILPGESVPRTSNIVVRDGVTNYEFVMPNGHTNVIPIFEANPSGPGTGVDEWGLGDLFDENQTDNSQGINGLFNTGTHGSSAQTTTQTGTGTEYTITVGNLTNGALIPAADRAASGGQVVITVNPADGYRLKENTLKATAKFGTGTEERTTIQTLVKNTAGQYILNMPAGNVTLTAEFEANPTGSAGTTPSTAANTAPKTNNSQSQVVGALAVAVVTNKNEAVVDTTGTIHAGGKVSINANGVTQSVSVADGSPIATPAGSDTTTGGSSGSETGSETGSQGQNGVGDTIHQPKPGTVTITTTPPATQTNPNPTPETNTISVQTAATVNGEIEIRGTTALAFGVNADRGYQYHSGSLIFSLVTKDGKNVTGSLVEKAGGNYMLPETVVQDGTNTTITLDNAFLMTVVSCAVTAVFDEMPHIITKAGTTADFTVKEKAHDGEKVIVTINQDAHGKKVESITVKDENNQTINITSENGVYSFEMPNKPVTITVNLVDKSFAVSFVDENGATIGADYIKASDTNADAGEKVILTLLEKAVAEGKEVTEIKAQLYKSENGTQTAVGTAVVVNNMEFTVPQLPTGAGQSDTYVLRITVKFAQKAFDVTVGTMTNGTVKGPVKADAGETITVTVTPNEGFRLRENSLSASATSGTTVQQVTAVNTQGVYTIRIPDLPTGQTAMSIVLNAIFEKDPNYTGKTTQKKSTLGIGVGINVSVTEHTNNAFIKNGTIIANGLELSAVSGSPSDKVLSSATSKAGYSQGDIGLGGAITVHVASAKTKAVVGKNVVLKLMDLSDLMLDAQSYDRFVTVAESSPTVRTVAPGSGVIIGQTGQSAAKVGVGAGLAIGVYGVDVVAAIEDGTKIELIDKFGNPSESAQLSDINISALHSSTEAMSAKAGSSGGTSVSPVLSLTVSGGNTSAYLGKGDGLKVKDDVNVSSMSDIARQIAANASAAGSGAGIGGSFVISVLNDSSRASVRRSIKANNIKVTNSSKNTVKAVSRASAAGASSRQPAVTGLPGSSGTTVTGDGSVPAGSESDQQANQNILGAASLANGVGTTNVNGGIVNNMNTGRQTAQTSEGSIKVAAGFALNIMSHVAESYLDEDIMIEAAKAVTVYSEALTSADVLANAAATQSEIGVGVAVAINIADYENTAKVLSGVKAENLYVQAVMIENPEGGEEEEAPPTSIVDAAVRKAVRQALDEALEASDLESTLGKEIIAKMITDIVAEMTAGTIETLLRGTGLEGMISTDIEHKVETFLATFDTKAADVIRNWMMQFILTEVQNLIINGTASGSQAQKPVSPVFPAEQAQKAKITPEQKLRIETAAIGMANELFGEFINVAQLKAFLKGNIVQTLKTKALAAAKNAMVAIPTAAFDALSSYLDLGIEEEDNTAKNTFVTQSVSGAGASSVGVAGSVAIAVIDGNTKAFIAAADETQYPVIVTGDVVIAALSRQKEKAVATSAVDADGDPDINTTAGSNSDIGDGNSAGTLHPSVMTNDINVAASRNGTVSASGQQQAGQTITITVTPDQGYRLAATNGVKVFRTDTSAEIPITTDANGNISFVIPTDYVAGSGIKFNIVSTFERITHTIGTTTVSMTNTAPGATGTTAAPAGAATVSVKSASDTATTGNSGSAGEGEKVFVTVTPATGYAIEKIVYKYNAAVPGQPRSPPTPTEQQITTVEDAMQNKYSFLMPSYDITGIELQRFQAAAEAVRQLQSQKQVRACQ